jgi:hypothetical protein
MEQKPVDATAAIPALDPFYQGYGNVALPIIKFWLRFFNNSSCEAVRRGCVTKSNN